MLTVVNCSFFLENQHSYSEWKCYVDYIWHCSLYITIFAFNPHNTTYNNIQIILLFLFVGFSSQWETTFWSEYECKSNFLKFAKHGFQFWLIPKLFPVRDILSTRVMVLLVCYLLSKSVLVLTLIISLSRFIIPFPMSCYYHWSKESGRLRFYSYRFQRDFSSSIRSSPPPFLFQDQIGDSVHELLSMKAEYKHNVGKE